MKSGPSFLFLGIVLLSNAACAVRGGSDPSQDFAPSSASVQNETLDGNAETGPAFLDSAPPSPPVVVLEVGLPDGTLCEWAAFGATLSFHGKRLNYDCNRGQDSERREVLLGDFELERNRLSVERAWLLRNEEGDPLEPWRLDDSEIVTMRVIAVGLEDGTLCHAADAQREIHGMPVRYVCDTPDSVQTVLLGELAHGADFMGLAIHGAIVGPGVLEIALLDVWSVIGE